jgi:hypothetical protein
MLASLAAGALLAGCGSSGKKPAATSGPSVTVAAPSPAASAAPGASAHATVAADATSASACAGGVCATMHGSSHAPVVGPLWPDSFTVTSGGHAAPASLEYEFLLAGQVVARRSHYTFRGTFHDTIEWPAPAVGYPLTLRAVVRSGPETLDIDYPVKVRR